MKAEEYYEQKRLRGFTDYITSNPNPDYSNEFYQQIFELMEGYKEAVINENLTQRSNIIELLEKYSIWLTKNGYMDTDWKDEPPFAIDEFLKNN